MKRIAYWLITFVLVFSMRCEEELGPVFIASESLGTIEFENSFASEYLISEETASNIAERFVWNKANFGVQTNVSYEIQSSLDKSFDSFEVIGSTSENNFAITVSHLLDLAERLGLDNDPATTDSDGQPNNKGNVYVRIRAYTGTTGNDSPKLISEIRPLQLIWLEQTVESGPCDGLWVVGDAVVDAGWNFVISTVCDEDVHSIELELTTGVFRFFETEGDWDSGLDFPHFEDEGYTIDSNFENDGSNDANFRFLGTPGNYELVIDNNEKTIELNASSDTDQTSETSTETTSTETTSTEDDETCDALWVVGDAIVDAGWNFVISTVCDEDIHSIELELTTGVFRFFETEGDWDSGLDFPHFEDEGYTIDSNFENDGSNDANFRFLGTPGNYELVIDNNEKTIELNASSDTDQTSETSTETTSTETSTETTSTEDDETCDALWVVGDAVVDAGWNFVISTVCDEDIHSIELELTAGVFRFFETEGDWDSGLDFPHFEDEGYTIDSNFENDGSNDANFRFLGTPGNYELVIDNNEKIIELNGSSDTDQTGATSSETSLTETPSTNQAENLTHQKPTYMLLHQNERTILFFGDCETAIGRTVYPQNVVPIDRDNLYKIVDRTKLDEMISDGESLSKVCTSCITNMAGLFQTRTSINGDISHWDTRNVTTMERMFQASTINADISKWNVRSVTNMNRMFESNSSFDKDISSWDVNSVTSCDNFASSTGAGWTNNERPNFTKCPCDSVWVVGDAIATYGWSFGVRTSCDESISKVRWYLSKGVFRFFETKDDWNSDSNFSHYQDEGYSIDSRLAHDGSSDANFKFLGRPGYYEIAVNPTDKKIELNGSLWAVGSAVPGGWSFNNDTIEFVEIASGVWEGIIALTSGVFRFFKNFGTWDTNNNYAFYDNEGFAIDLAFENDGSGDANFRFVGTPSTYRMNINTNALTIKLNSFQ